MTSKQTIAPVSYRRTNLLIAITCVAFACLAPIGAAAETIATADGETPGTRIDITELKRTSGDTVTLKFTLVNDTDGSISPYGLFNAPNVHEIHLIDAAGKKKYLTVKDSKNACVCSANLTTNLKAGKSLNLWAKFPAPPADVKEVSVVFPHFIPTDAPLSD